MCTENRDRSHEFNTFSIPLYFVPGIQPPVYKRFITTY
jgi:hypothetical protein